MGLVQAIWIWIKKERLGIINIKSHGRRKEPKPQERNKKTPGINNGKKHLKVLVD